jgi:hypothetical protein
MEIYMTFMLIDIKQELNNLVLQLNTEGIYNITRVVQAVTT